jgi:hypothetical protein
LASSSSPTRVDWTACRRRAAISLPQPTASCDSRRAPGRWSRTRQAPPPAFWWETSTCSNTRTAPDRHLTAWRRGAGEDAPRRTARVTHARLDSRYCYRPDRLPMMAGERSGAAGR